MNAVRLTALLSFTLPLLAAAQTATTETTPAPAATPRPSAVQIQDKQTAFGAMVAPASLPAGAQAAYGFAGVPEVGAGWRQGVGPVEIDARLKFDYFALALGLEGHVKYSVHDANKLQIAPSLGVGVVLNSGATYIDPHNFGYFGLRLIPGAVASYRIAETASLLGELTVPVDIPLTSGGGTHLRPLLGGGGEIYIGDDLSACAVAQFGTDVIKEPLGVTQARFAFALRLGVGYRFF